MDRDFIRSRSLFSLSLIRENEFRRATHVDRPEHEQIDLNNFLSQREIAWCGRGNMELVRPLGLKRKKKK